MYSTDDKKDPGKYKYIAEFEDPSDAYTFAAELHGRFEYKGLSIILGGVMRTKEKEPQCRVKFIFTPEGFVLDGKAIENTVLTRREDR